MLIATKNVHQSIPEAKGHAMSPARVTATMIAPCRHLKHALLVSDDALLPVMIHAAVKIVLLSFLDLKDMEIELQTANWPTTLCIESNTLNFHFLTTFDLKSSNCTTHLVDILFQVNYRIGVKAMALRVMARKLESKLFPMLSLNSPLHSHATSFGFKEVREEEKSQMVGNVFSSVASNYDLMNDFMSGGLHRLWKDRLVSKLNPFPGMKHLDVAGGTGDVSFRILETINNIKRRAIQDVLEDDLMEETRIYVCDINPNMLNVGQSRALEKGLGKDKSLVWVEGDAEALRFEDGTMDGYTIAFGIRNVTHIEKVLAEAYRVLKRGGRFLCLELSHVEVPLFKELYDYYSFSVIPAIGEMVAGDRDSYQYLVESIRRFPPQAKFASMIADAGFQKVEYENLVGGVVAIHSGLKI
ncbi:hypothetical protein LWI29_020175 [Acer saccharum]|uniref:2-methoxy-6-polyprenyl-1,4-benzoquinol methylase, mitochondrial n=1 Tax=Acer saccharum TaxID=4024 RepID=A0AA39RFG6_ACESA|nr:hypothetical protein LWI29_020175 [Acer saccharum]